ncbi:flavin-containing monooxygenase FMO GS-OX5 isoform X2 [Eurytemora carolleeae]|uniref:flavin-containing monooxygenase FMO GS-OX5 isoform X2 n=1 Tax=Eurytemora carolleeae TaxID=1294199 RepID=UPI000C782C88|nr:flavin-containing monooxygenase FMO GS-OX5 isoform X2 [Eurytemora carolleeae]|eukprot:XP_023348490.1 flavin-containing monooxygenase FMO GS-OX5-like isoform X2 [Eurytemora affinis]
MEIAIIGAGAGGLCAARHASASYRCKPTVFEKSDRIGGVWVYNPKTGKDEKGERIVSSMYRDLKTNLPKEIMCYPDVPMKSSIKDSFIHHSQVLEYLEEFAEQFDLKKYIKFNDKVVNIQPTDPKETEENNNETWNGVENGDHVIAKENSGSICQVEKKKWKIKYFNSESNKTQFDYFDAVIVCTGTYAEPYYPDIPGTPYYPDIPGIETFQGKVIHSSDYRYASTFRNEEVVILGASFSGADIGLDLVKSASKMELQ